MIDGLTFGLGVALGALAGAVGVRFVARARSAKLAAGSNVLVAGNFRPASKAGSLCISGCRAERDSATPSRQSPSQPVQLIEERLEPHLSDGQRNLCEIQLLLGDVDVEGRRRTELVGLLGEPVIA